MIEPFKYMIQPIAIERDADGNIVREIPAEIVSAYSLAQAAELIGKFEEQLKASQNGGVSLPPSSMRSMSDIIMSKKEKAEP
jgi:hypothetical protein